MTKISSSYASTTEVADSLPINKSSVNPPLLLGQWTILNRQVFLYQSDQGSLSAVIQESCGRIQELTAERIKNGIHPNMPSDCLAKMVRTLPVDQIAVVLHFNQKKELELAFCIKLEGAGRVDEKFKECADKLVIEARQQKHLNNFQTAIDKYQEALKKYKQAIIVRKTRNEDISDIAKTIQGIKKEFFIFHFSKDLCLYLPSLEDQKTFKEYVDLFGAEEKFFTCLLKAGSEEIAHRCCVDHFTCAFAYEALDNKILAAQSYLALFYLQLKKGQTQAALVCLNKTESLIQLTSDPFARAHFLEKLDRKLLVDLHNSTADPYLDQLLLQKDAIRHAFEELLKELDRLSPQLQAPECFICFNTEEEDVVEWSNHVLLPDLGHSGIKPLNCFKQEPGKEPHHFQDLIRRSDQVLMICTPELKRKCDEGRKAPTGVAQEIRLAIERFNDSDKHETIFPIYLKGDRDSSCPAAHFEPIVETYFTILDKSTDSCVFTYYSNAFELFGGMRGIPPQITRSKKEEFQTRVDSILKGSINKIAVEKWRGQREIRNKVLFESIADRTAAKTRMMNLPQPPKDFTGRENELLVLHDTCKQQRRVALTGLGGIGKTALALKYANDYQSHYQFIHFMSVSSPESIIEGLLQLADDLHISKGKPEERLKQLKLQLDRLEYEYLLIFDGLDTQEAFRELENKLPNRGRCLLLTTRLPEHAEKLEFERLKIKSLLLEDAVNYLLKTTSSNERDQAALLAEKLGCLPLALTHAAAYIRTRRFSIQRYREEFDKYDVALFEEKHLTLRREERTILTTWKMSLNAIEKEHNDLFAKEILAFFSFLSTSSIPFLCIHIWTEMFFKQYSEIDLGDSLSHLYNYSLIDSIHSESYTVHQLVQSVTRYLLSPENRLCHLSQALGTFSNLFELCNLYNDKKLRKSFLFSSFILHCEQLKNHFYKTEAPSLETTTVAYFLFSYAICLVKREFYAEALICLNTTLKIVKKCSPDDRLAQRTIHCNIGVILRIQGKLEEARHHYRKALTSSMQELSKREDVALATITLGTGIVLQEQGKFTEAADHYNEALTITQQVYGTRNHLKVAAVIQQIGVLQSHQLKNEEALASLNEALEIVTLLRGGDRNHHQIAVILLNLGNILRRQGKWHEAYIHLREALKIQMRLYGSKNHSEVAANTMNMGIIFIATNQFDRAASCFEEALEIQKSIFNTENHPSTAEMIFFKGALALNQSKLEVALIHFEHALKIQKEIYPSLDHPNLARTLLLKGTVLHAQRKLEEAASSYAESLKIQIQIGDNANFLDMFKTRLQLIKLSYQQNRKEEAVIHCLEASKTAFLLPVYDLISERDTIEQIGDLLWVLGQPEAACSHYEKLLRIHNENPIPQNYSEENIIYHGLHQIMGLQSEYELNNDTLSTLRDELKEQAQSQDDFFLSKPFSILLKLGILSKEQNKFKEALTRFKELLSILKETSRENRLLSVIMLEIGVIYIEQGELEEAQSILQEALDICVAIYGTRIHARVALILHNLGMALETSGDWNQAVSHYQEALDIYAQIYGTRFHSESVATVYNMGVVLWRQNKLRESLNYLEQALILYKQAHPNCIHPSIARVFNALGVVKLNLGEKGQAAAYFKESIAVHEAYHGTRIVLELADTLFTLGSLEAGVLNDSAQGLAHLREAVHIYTQLGLGGHEKIFIANATIMLAELTLTERSPSDDTQAICPLS